MLRPGRLVPALFADITEAGFDLLTWRKGPAPDLPEDEFTQVTSADDRGREHHYDLTDTTISLEISEGPRKGQQVSLRQVTRRVPARSGGTRQIHALTSRTDLDAAEVCWRLSSRWRRELLPLRPHPLRPRRPRQPRRHPRRPRADDPNPAKKAAAAQVHRAEALAQAAQATRDARLLELRSPAPGTASILTNQALNRINTPIKAAWRELGAAEDTAAVIPARVRLGDITPDMARLDTEVKQITHAIRMAAYNAETTLARALHGHYPRAEDEAYALIREALTASGDIIPGNGDLLIRLDPLTAPRRTRALAALCQQLTQAHARYPETELTLRYQVKDHPGPA